MALAQGQVLNNRYRVVKLLGKGGFGAVYRAWDIPLNRLCALKENTEISPEAERQFDREASLLAGLHHPNLPVVSDHFSIAGQGQYLVMDFVEGDDLQAMLDRAKGPLPENQALDWILQVCDALGYLHSQQPPIIHRDVKPANIKITPQGQAILVDFGIAKVYNPKLKTTLGARAVTPGYSPTEQYGVGITDGRSDVYALGATLYALLTGSDPVESVQRSAGSPFPAPRDLNPAISPAVEAAILRAMDLIPDQRWQSIADFKSALEKNLPKPPIPVNAHLAAPLQAAAAPKPAGEVVMPSQVVVQSSPVSKTSQLMIEADGTASSPLRNGLMIGGSVAIVVMAMIGIAVVLLASGLIGRRWTPPATRIANHSPTAASSIRYDPTKSPTLLTPSSPAGTASPGAASAGDAYWASTKANRAYLRAGPHLNHPILGSYSFGTRVEVIGKTSDNQWFLVIADDSKTGWLYMDWLTMDFDSAKIAVVTNLPTPPPPPTKTPEPPDSD